MVIHIHTQAALPGPLTTQGPVPATFHSPNCLVSPLLFQKYKDPTIPATLLLKATSPKHAHHPYPLGLGQPWLVHLGCHHQGAGGLTV